MEKGGACFSPRPCQRACLDPLMRQVGDALTHQTCVAYGEANLR